MRNLDWTVTGILQGHTRGVDIVTGKRALESKLYRSNVQVSSQIMSKFNRPTIA